MQKPEATWSEEASLFDKLNEVAWRSSFNSNLVMTHLQIKRILFLSK
jgi:hypothetical protein